MYDHEKKIRKLISLLLAIALVMGTVRPLNYALAAGMEQKNIAEKQTEQSIDKKEAETVSGQQAAPEETPSGAVPDTDAETESETKRETESESETETESETLPANVLTADNKEQIEEQKKEQQQEGLDAEGQNTEGQNTEGQDIDPYLSVTLTGETDFAEDLQAQIRVLKEKELDDTIRSLSDHLKESGAKLAETPLPLAIDVLDADGAEAENPGKVSVKISMEDAESLKELSLYHQKADDTWEELFYEIEKATDTEPSCVTFTTESFGPFLFVREEAIDTSEKSLQAESRPSLKAPAKRAVESISIDEFTVSFSDGASLKDGKYIWKPTESASGHMFVYTLNYTVSGTYSQGSGKLRFELPLHILKDRNGNWADSFDCPYILRSEVSEGEEPDFVYEIDEEHNKVVIYNYKDIPSGEAGYIEFAYTTTKSTLDYVDMSSSTQVNATISATGEDGTAVTKDAAGKEVCIDTRAAVSSAQITDVSHYTEWQSSWGARPADADRYDYLVWTVRTNIAGGTSPYNFSLTDTFSDLGGSVIGYRFAGQTAYSSNNTIPNQRSSSRYDYVLTRHSKEEAGSLLDASGKYEVKNHVEVKADPVDQVDADTTAASSYTWKYERPKYEPPQYETPENGFGAEKYGNTSDYTLQEFLDGTEESIDNLRYYMEMRGYPYPWTLADGATGTVEDARGGKYGQKKVSYELTDDTVYLEGTDTPLEDNDYDLTGIEWTPTMRTAVFDEATLSFKETGVKEYQDTDAVTIWVRTGTEWKKAAVYDMKTKNYTEVDVSCVSATKGNRVSFTPGVKGVRFTCENAYYHTKLSVYPTVSLKRTDHVLSLIGGDKTVISLINQADVRVAKQDGTDIFNREVQGTDYIRKVIRNSRIEKNISQTKNDKRRKQVEVTWCVSAEETYKDNEGEHYLPQDSGIFYDLVPQGAGIDKSSVKVYASGRLLTEGSYTISILENYRDSGRTLLKIEITESSNSDYRFTYSTLHTHNAIQDYGKNLLNSVAYETGNEKIAGGYPDNGGRITEKDLLSDLDADTDAEKFLYAEARYGIGNILMAASTGLLKQVKSAKDAGYASHSTVNQGGSYAYQVRLANDKMTQAKDIVFFDSLENFYQKADETVPTLASDWKGTLTGIDVSNLTAGEIHPVVYLSKTDDMNIHNHHDLAETAGGEPVWLEYSAFKEKYGLESARAIAVDAAKKTDGTDFVLGNGQSMIFTIYMKAPDTDTTGKADPVAYNNIYVERTAIRGSGEDKTELPQFYHQDYTSLHFRVAGDVSLKKVDATDMASPVQGAVYLLRGTSDYGTEYSLSRTSDKNGRLYYEGIEKGIYELLETSCSDDWLLNTEVYTVTVDANGKVSIAGLNKDGEGRYLVGDRPRIHADLSIKKLDSVTRNPVNGAQFLLSGTSAYGTDVFLQAVAEGVDKGNNPLGSVTFQDIELGTYELVETGAAEGYIPADTVWTVKVDERGVAVLYDGVTEAPINRQGSYEVANEPLHTVRFVKSSTYGTNIFLPGARFSLNGISDYGTNVSAAATSDADGLVVFDGLEPGTYQLKETEAPEDHELNKNLYTVTVKPDGTFTIDGLSKVSYLGAQLYDFKDVKTTGVICVTKMWVDNKTNAERPIPDMSVSTEVPSKDPRGYTLTFDANGGKFVGDKTTNNRVYTASGTLVDGEYLEPVTGPDNRPFKGWYTAAEGGEEYSLDDQKHPTTPLTGDVTVYAQYVPVPKYAVAIYDICVDTLQDGEAGLTFGPALGGPIDEDGEEVGYIESYKNHTPDGTTAKSNPHRCVHDDDWETIVEWNTEDPYVYEQCIAEGCTHSVSLNPEATETVVSKEFNASLGTGDGPSILYNELKTGNCLENLRWCSTTQEEYSNWGASRIRAMLNGAELTDRDGDGIITDVSDSTKESDVNKSAAVYTESNCLFAAFPEVLKEHIGAKEVRYETFDESWPHEAHLKNSYDRLWLFSPNELWNSSCITDSSCNYPLQVGDSIKDKGYAKFASCTVDSGNVNDDHKGFRYDSFGVYNEFWLRSQYDSISTWICFIESYGSVDYSQTCTNDLGVAPGFTLKR